MQRTLKGIRSDLDKSQKEMAKLIGIPEATYQRYERYESRIPYEVMLTICDIAGIENPRIIKYK